MKKICEVGFRFGEKNGACGGHGQSVCGEQGEMERALLYSWFMHADIWEYTNGADMTLSSMVLVCVCPRPPTLRWTWTQCETKQIYSNTKGEVCISRKTWWKTKTSVQMSPLPVHVFLSFILNTAFFFSPLYMYHSLFRLSSDLTGANKAGNGTAENCLDLGNKTACLGWGNHHASDSNRLI